MRTALAAAALMLLAAGCSSTGTEPTPIDPLPVTYSAPTPIAGRDWHLSQYAGESSLAYGVAETDDVNLALACADGSGRVSMFRDVPDAAHASSGWRPGETAGCSWRKASRRC